MSYQSKETSRNSGQPVELYRFIRGSRSWTYCTHTSSIAFQEQVFEPYPINRGRISENSDTIKNGLTVDLPRSNEFAQLCLGFDQLEITTLTIFRGHLSDLDGEFISLWKGRVKGAKASGNTVAIDCESIFSSMTRLGLRATYQLTCRHVLYSTNGCRADQESFKVVSTVSSAVQSSQLVAIADTGHPDGYFTGGLAQFSDGLFRLVLSSTADLIKLSNPVSVGSGETVLLYPGCDHTKDTCSSKFSNVENFGGFPYMPGKNPFSSGSLV